MKRFISLAVMLIMTAQLSAEVRFKRNDQVIAQYVSHLVSHYHYLKKPFDNNMSKMYLEEILYSFDNQKRYFTQSDVDEFARYRFILDDMLEKGDLSYASVIYNRYLKRLEERVNFVHKRLDQDFDFSKDEEMEIDRKESNWATTKTELDDIWRRLLKNELIVMEYDKKKQKEANSEEKSKKEKKEEMFRSSLPPKKQLLKRYDNFLKYQKEKTPIEVLEIMLGSMARCYDPHSNYLAPQTEEEFNISMNLNFSGIGAQLLSQDGYTLVTRIIPGGPASKDKRLESGDKIYAVAQGDGAEVVDIMDMNLKKVVNLIRGEKGTQVNLHLIKDTGERKIIDLVRGKVELKESEAKGEIKEIAAKDGKKTKIGVVQLPSFYIDFEALSRGDKNGKSSTRDVAKLIKKLKAEGMEALVLDLRNNGGGSLLESVLLTGLFIDKGPVVQIKDATGRVDVRDDHPAGTLYDGPLIVMTNYHSASAAEIFAAAIQDYKRGLLVGAAKTHGKGTVQTVKPLNQLPYFRSQKDFKPGELKYTIAKFYRVNGGSTQKEGVRPDIVFPDYGDFEKYREQDLRHCLAWDEVPALDVGDDSKFSLELKALRQRSEVRRSQDKNFRLLMNDLRDYEKILARKKVTLNRDKRFVELEKIEDKSKKRRELYDMLAGISDDDEDEDRLRVRDDFFLLETLQIGKDMLEMVN